ncbi:unnamed protein product [Miscanthus lutarioriparius]|uniref:Uncharacterized protein n=1 Tax=Miscanthus lutarioriparius TaxID=422564 RepID=A0A811MR39_9POAL|nr:unnamed protein product [Miscanthus lutarioriparius]
MGHISYDAAAASVLPRPLHHGLTGPLTGHRGRLPDAVGAHAAPRIAHPCHAAGPRHSRAPNAAGGDVRSRDGRLLCPFLLLRHSSSFTPDSPDRLYGDWKPRDSGRCTRCGAAGLRTGPRCQCCGTPNAAKWSATATRASRSSSCSAPAQSFGIYHNQSTSLCRHLMKRHLLIQRIGSGAWMQRYVQLNIGSMDANVLIV